MKKRSFNPPHLMHIKTFQIAKKRLEEKGNIVIGGFISPSSDQ